VKNLIIVESPAKAKTIKNFLGKNYDVIASFGHIRDLPKSSFGINIKDDEFVPQYRVPKEAKKAVDDIKDKAKKADTIYIATDEDREGEAIGFHIAHAIGKKPETLPRIVFHEITKKAILHAIENPRHLDDSLVNAQQTRRLLDRIVGYKLSPLLGSKIQRGLSAGRVQSSALKIVVDREKEIKAFIPQEYYTITATFNNIDTNLVEYKSEKIDKLSIGSKEFADEIVSTVSKEDFVVASIDNRKRTTKTPPPFMTSTLQQTASSMLGFSPKKTMMVAQSLYEGVKTDSGVMGIITYMRTDSLNLSNEAVESARDYISKNFGDKYLPSKPKNYVTKNKSAQEAHEAIRPVRVDFSPDVAKSYLKPDEFKLYRLIYSRFLACQMSDAEFDTQSIIFASDSSKFKINGRKLIFDGFYKVWGSDEKDKLLPNFEVNSKQDLQKLDSKQNFTEPPSRYSEASLIKTLEAQGIGRPSTYAPTITILQTREYIEVNKKQIVPTEIAFKVTDVLEEHFNDIVSSTFTANMENELDLVAENKKDWQDILKDFYNPFMEKIEDGKKNIKSQKVVIPIGEKCPDCGEELVKRKGRYGEFISCNSYPKCKYTRNIEREDAPKITDVKCDKCGADMVVKQSRRGEFLACSAYPDCKNTKSLIEPKKLDVPCPKCGGNIIERKSKRGVFYGCDKYPDCKFIANFEPTSKKCPECSHIMGKRVYRKKDIYECLNSECKHREDA
jgi:DNA topoisomerase-1